MAELTWPSLLTDLIAGKDLSAKSASWAMDRVMSGETSPVVLAGFLTALAAKGETAAELRGLADSMQAHALPLRVPREVVDIVGTGGDCLSTANISTMAAITVASAGTPVVKHGNRASSSASGSADCLEALGVNLQMSSERVEECFDELGITFVFANVFHPAMRFAAPTRKELGVRTAFNFLGPLTNPARPRCSLIGVASEPHAPIVADVLAERGSHAIVVRGCNGMDELSTVVSSHMWVINEGQVEHMILDPVTDLGFKRASIEDLRGGDPAENAMITRRVFAGETGAVRDSVVLNAGAAFVAEGRVEGTRSEDGSPLERMRAGVKLACEMIDSGACTQLLERWVSFSQQV